MKIAAFCLLLVALLGTVSCSKQAKVSSSSRDQLFQSAAPEVKGLYERAVAAAKTNDYVGGMVIFMELQKNTSLTAEQRQAVGDSMTAIQDNVYEGINRGDPKAKEALNELRKLRGR
jgi:hypothetical protein